MVRGLAREFDVDVVVAEDPGDAAPSDFAQACASITTFAAPRGIGARIGRWLCALLPNESYLTAGQVPGALRRHVSAAVSRTRYSAVHVDDLQLHSVIPPR